MESSFLLNGSADEDRQPKSERARVLMILLVTLFDTLSISSAVSFRRHIQPTRNGITAIPMKDNREISLINGLFNAAHELFVAILDPINMASS